MSNRSVIPIVHLRPKHVQPVWAGHPWIFPQAIERIEGTITNGDEVIVMDPKKNLLGRGFYSAKSAISVRLLTRNANKELNEEFFRSSITKAVEWRREWFSLPSSDTTGFRLINSEGDNLSGLIVDVYNNVLSVQFLTAGMKRIADLLVRLLVEVTQCQSVIEIASAKHQAIEGFTVTEGLIHGPVVEQLSFHERGFVFNVPVQFTDGKLLAQKTGYFFDQRETRALIETIAKNKTVLDTFCYAGGFSLAAARAGASAVIAVDRSSAALEIGKASARAAGLSDKIQWITADIKNYLNEQAQQQQRYDIVIVDPPKLAQGSKDVDDAVTYYRRLNASAMRLVQPGGLILSCSCSQAVSEALLHKTLAQSARDIHRNLTLLKSVGQPPDHPSPAAFPEGRYLKCVLAKVD